MLFPTVATTHEVNHVHELGGLPPRYGAFQSFQTHLSSAETLPAQKDPFQIEVPLCQMCNLSKDI